jgi:hypothetical protein
MSTPRERAIADLIVAVKATRRKAEQLRICSTEDLPADGDQNLLLIEYGERCLDAAGWLHEAQAALVPVTPGPGLPSEKQLAVALLEAQTAVDRCRDIVDRELTTGHLYASISRTCGERDPEWSQWFGVVRTTAEDLRLQIDYVRDVLRVGWSVLIEAIADSATESGASQDGGTTK